MKQLRSNEIVIANQIKDANNFFDRLIGLMFKKSMDGFDCLKLSPCNSIHTFFMKYPIDVIFSDKQGNIIKIIRNMKPWRVSRIYFTASVVYEFSAGTIDEKIDETQTLEEVCLS